MSQPVKLQQPRVRVVMEDASSGEMTECIVQTSNRDAVRYDVVRGRKQWPGMSEAPMLWMTFCAWSAMKRGGDTDLDFDAFNELCLEVAAVDADGELVKPGELGVTANPTNAEADLSY